MMPPFRAQHVPIIGEPTKVLQHYHTFVMQCQCPAGTVSVIIGNGEGVACPGCGGVPTAELTDGKITLGVRRTNAVVN